MKSIPPKTDAVDDAWAAGGEGDGDFDLAGLFTDAAPRPPPATKAGVGPVRTPAVPVDVHIDVDVDDFAMVELGELFVEDHHTRPTPVPGAAHEHGILVIREAAGAAAASGPAATSSKSTLRPPQPEAEYVADMMERALSPWPARGPAGVTPPAVPKATPSGFGHAAVVDFDFSDIDTEIGTRSHSAVPPPDGRPTPVVASPSERPTRPGDPARSTAELDLDLELDRALGSLAPSTMPSLGESASPLTQRGLGESSVPPSFLAVSGVDPDAVEIIDLGPDTPPPPPPAAGAVAPPPRFAPLAPPRPGSAAGGRRGSGFDRTPPSLDTPFGNDSASRFATAVSARHATPAASRAHDPISLVRDRFDLGDYSGALVQAEALLEDRPNDSDALRFAEACRVQLQQMYLSRIGDRALVPRVVMEPDQLRWLSLDHRAGFLLSVIDGAITVDDLLDVSSMSELDTLRILYDFIQQGVIQMGPSRRRSR